MAFDFSKLNIFAKMGTRARIAVIAGSIVGVITLMYFAIQYFGSSDATTGASAVAGAGAVASVPGGELTPEYYRALQQANVQAAEQAKMTGESAIPTLVNIGSPQAVARTSTDGCNVICADDVVNVKPTLESLVKEGKISPEVSATLQELADKNPSVEDYAAELDRLVREGKLTPEQARKLLDQYKKQHANNQLKESAKVMDDMIKNGVLPLDTATQLLANQKMNMSPADYAAELDRLVKEGKITAAEAQRLLAQYTQQKAKGIIAKSVASLKAMARSGQLIPEVENALIELENAMVPVDVYAKKLDDFVSAGKLIPLTSKKILDEYQSQKAEIGPTGSVNKMLQQAEAAAYGEINDLLKEGKMTQEVAVQLTDLIQNDTPLDNYIKVVTELRDHGKITPDIAKLKIEDYRAVKGLRNMSQALAVLQGNDASTPQYISELKRGVQAGELTTAQADQLLDEYKAYKSSAATAAAPAEAATGAFAQLQQRLQAASAEAEATEAPTTFEGPQAPGAAAASQFEAQQLAQQREMERKLAEDRNAAIDATVTAMSGQAQQLIGSWAPPVMQQKAGTPETKSDLTDAASAGEKSGKSASSKESEETEATGPPIVKAGTIIFAVLDTGVNSDYPESPVMATIVDGKFKSAKMMGKLMITKSVSGQLDRVTLNFTLMNMDQWDKTKTVTAFAIDPDTARTVLASSVDYHYLQRFGAIMATSFLQGYASAITQAGTSTTGIFGTSTTHPELSPSQKIATALGQMGQALGTATQNYVNIPPTVKVDAGVGLGILFMADVT